MDAVENLQEKVEVQPIRKTNLLKVKVCDSDPNQAKQIANTLAEVFVELNLKYDRGEARSVYDFTKRQLEIAKKNLERSENRLKEYREKTGISVLGEEARSNIKKIVELESKVAELRAKRVGIESKLEEVKRQLHPRGEWELKGVSPDMKQVELLSQGIKNETAIAPYLSDIEKPIYQQLLAELVDLETEIHSLEASEQTLLQTIEEYNKKLNLLPEKELELARLTRAAEVNEEIYKMLLTKNEEARIAEAMEIGNVRIIDPAITPDKPIKPKKKLNTLIGGMLGVMFGFAFAFLREHLDSSIKGVEDVERANLPIIGVIPSISQKREKKFKKEMQNERKT
jgi:tyrosine-protein kinase Etk/Wzc